MKDILTGKLVRLCASEPDESTKAFSAWDRDPEFAGLLHINPERFWSLKQAQKWAEEDAEKEADEFFFAIRALADEKMIGFTGLMDISWPNREAWVVIGIGEAGYRGRGYGTEAMSLILQYAFIELNLHRAALHAYEHNARALHSYEKIGFKREGRTRGVARRNNQPLNSINMGVLRSEWLVTQKGTP